MKKYIERCVANRPKLEITGHTEDHVLSSPYFKRYAGHKHTIEVEDGTVYLRTGIETRGVIGWIRDAEE